MFVCRHFCLFAHRTKHIALQWHGIKTHTTNYRSSCNKSDQYVPRRRVVVTGFGVVSPIGCDTTTAWHNILNGHCGIRSLDSQKYEKLPCKIAAEICEEDLKLSTHFSKSELRSVAKTTAYALISGSIEEMKRNIRLKHLMNIETDR